MSLLTVQALRRGEEEEKEGNRPEDRHPHEGAEAASLE